MITVVLINFIDSKNIIFEYPIITNAKETCNLFQINGYPTNIVIDKKEEIYFSFTGGFSGIVKVVSKSIQKSFRN